MSDTKPTPLEWRIDAALTNGGAPVIAADDCWLGRPRTIAKVLFENGSEDPEVHANAALIVEAVNACKRLNPDDPMAVARQIEAAFRCLAKIPPKEIFSATGTPQGEVFRCCFRRVDGAHGHFCPLSALGGQDR